MSIVVQLYDAVLTGSSVFLLLFFSVKKTQSQISRVYVFFEVEPQFFQLVNYFV